MDSGGIKTIEAHIFNLKTRAERIASGMFLSNSTKDFNESPWSKDGTMLSYCDRRKLKDNTYLSTAYIYDLHRQKIVKMFERHKVAVWSPKSQSLALTDGRSVYLFDLEKDTIRELHRLQNKYLKVSTMHWSPTGGQMLLEVYTLDKNIFSLGGRYVELMIDCKTGKKLRYEKLMIADPTQWSWK